MAAEKVSLAFV